MIVSTQGKVVFFHNPKVAGASVHASLSRFHDGHVNGWGVGEGNRLLAHDGIDEFAAKNPTEWARIKNWKMFSLYRDRYERFMSSFSQYSRSFGDVDTRFATFEKSRDYLFTMIDTLASYGTAEAILDEDAFVLFRPQWIYLHSEDHDVDLTCFHISEIDQLFAAIEERVGEPIERKRINEREQLDLPGPLAALLSKGHFARRIGQLPGTSGAKSWLKQRFKAAKPSSGLMLSEGDIKEVKAFVADFYARDQAFVSPRTPVAAAERSPISA